jgi:hypothetical protein
MAASPSGPGPADQATGQEQQAKEVLAELDKLDAGDEAFEELLPVGQPVGSR